MQRGRFRTCARACLASGSIAMAAAACGADGPRLAAPVEAQSLLQQPATTAMLAQPSTTLEPPPTTVAPTVPPPVLTSTTLAAPTTAAPTTAAPAVPRPVAKPAPAAVARVVAEQAFVPFADAGGVTLHLPAARVELVGFHQSSHDGAQAIAVRAGVVRSVVLEDRGRDTALTGAADVVVDPTVEIRSPVTGRVISANTYRLYCKYSDDLVFIEPDERPGWQVKVFHIDGFQVRPGQRVEAGVTVLAGRATVLPFESQVEEFGALPPWPHVHIEVIDPSVPDRPTPGGGC